jgi:alkylation response protein AidB-like acyl-CoA dehydrogenase
MSDKVAMKMAEAAREAASDIGSFGGDLFMGRFDFSAISPFPVQSTQDRQIGDALFEKVRVFLETRVDADLIDREDRIPSEVMKGLKELGLFGMKIPAEYGGLGLSQTNYNRVIKLLGSHSSALTVLLSAHQSIGVPQPLMLFGTQEQKEKYLPRLAAGAISAFALTEPDAGSDPSHMLTTAVKTPDGEAFIINGQKLWISNGPIADIMIVMARTSPEGTDPPEVSAFIVETPLPGFSSHPCRFMGLRGLPNGLLQFEDVTIPAGNLLGEQGRGLKIALTTLNTGRLTLPAASSGAARQILAMLRPWVQVREQWGRSIGEHEAVAGRMANLVARCFALDAVADLTSAMADAKESDLRVEAAMAKLYSSEIMWKIADDALQTRGGRGYETADSLRERGEMPIPVERALRDARINTIIEGTSDIMHLFIAREVLDPHLKATGMKPGSRGVSVARALRFYTIWFPSLFLPRRKSLTVDAPHLLQRHLIYIEKETRKLARIVFYAMLKHRHRLEMKQRVLARIVDIGTSLFAMSAVISKAVSHLAANPADKTPVELADLLCRLERNDIRILQSELRKNTDEHEYQIAMDLLNGSFAWLEEGVTTSWTRTDPAKWPHDKTSGIAWRLKEFIRKARS